MEHIIPSTEIEKHTESFDCACNPLVTTYNVEKTIVVHGSLNETLNESNSDQLIDLLNKEVIIGKLKNELFDLANKFACEGLGEIAVKLHSINNYL
jgi:hypothetical protein